MNSTNPLRGGALPVLLALALPAAAFAAGVDGGETVLWPSASGATSLSAQPSSRAFPLPDGAMAVETGPGYTWPGVRMDFAFGEMDLSRFGGVTLLISNTTDRAEVVNLSVKGHTTQGQTPGGSLALEPREAGVLHVDFINMPWALDTLLPLRGMRGYPQTPGCGTTFDLKRVTSFHIFLFQDGRPGGFAVCRIVASGAGAPQKVLPAATFLPFVDEYGQFMHDDWPGKIHCDADLEAARAAEEAWMAEHAASPIPDADEYGGWAGGPQLEATGFFRTEKVGGMWWLVDPAGHLFFSHGVDCVRMDDALTGVSFREEYFSWLPKKDDPVFGQFRWTSPTPMTPFGFYKDPEHLPYDTFNFLKANSLRKYGPNWKDQFAERAHTRLRAWGLNTIANWSDPAICAMSRTPYTANFTTSGPSIEGSSGVWGKLRDPFAPEFAESARKGAARAAERTGDDPWCIGWFVDNELSWGNDDCAVGRAVLGSPATQPAKIAARDLLAAKYGDIARLDEAWGTRYGSWEGFLVSTNMPDETLCGPDLRDIHRDVVAQYFRTVRDAVKAVAPHRLYLGCRIAWGSPSVYRESARFCDAVSVNIYGRLPLRELPEDAEDKPMLVGEFHFGALDRGMFHTGLAATRSQEERARCYLDFVNACLDNPRFVGCHWFQFTDQALTGRPDGENYQIGFVNVADVPYPELVAAAREVASTMYLRRFGRVADGDSVR